MRSNVKLKRCPFCYGPARRERYRLPLTVINVMAWRVLCEACGAQIYGMRKCDATRKWNRRALV